MGEYSVLMSVYGKEKADFLRQSMESIFAQTLPADDFVLVCDGPLTEELDGVIAEYLQKYPSVLHPVRLERNVGLGPALNEGLRHCKNELVARMDSDDYALAHRCELQVQAFSQNPELGIVGGFIREFEQDPAHVIAEKQMPCDHEAILKYAKKRCPLNHPTVMYRKSAVLSAGGYPNLPLHEDYALWVHLLMNGVLSRNLPEVLCHMRVDGGLYSRRGGLGYCKTAVAFRWYLLKRGFCNFGEFLISAGAVAVVGVFPVGLRKWIYRRFLRK